jgi:glycosyltransferase involved in cell wall biosynthesis
MSDATVDGLRVSLITTVKDAAEEIGPFLASLAAQTRVPDEVIVVDGGSSDGTVERLREATGITLIESPGANISRGRNVAIAAAAHDVLALTDADCVLEAEWLERLLEPIERGADVSMGFYRPISETFLQTCVAAVNLPDADDIDPDRFMPSGRSVAFTRAAIDAAAGYPEWLDIGEDMYVDLAWRRLGLDMRFAPDAVANWRLRPTLRETWIQYFRYARGDAIAGMYPDRHALRFGVYSAGLYAWSTRGSLRKVVALAGIGAYVAGPLRRVASRFDDPATRLRALAAVPALMAFVDVAKMAGWLAGTADLGRGTAKREPVDAA